jgi:hypothetical protein
VIGVVESCLRTDNIAGLVAGILALVANEVLAEYPYHLKPEGEAPEITLLALAFQSVGGMMFIVLANVCYRLGPAG